MAKATKLTESTCKAATYTGTGNSKCILWDAEVKGLGLRVFPSGSKGWVLRYTPEGGKTTLMSLPGGGWPGVTVEAARKAGRVHLGGVATGADPKAERDEKRARPTVGEIWADFETKVLPGMKSGKDLRWRYQRHLAPRWAGRRVESITRGEVISWHEEITKASGPYAANRALAWLRRLIEWAWQREQVKLPGGNPAKLDKSLKNPEQPRKAWVRPEQMAAFWQAVLAEPEEDVRAALMLFPLTGTRRNELLSLRWEQVDLSWGEHGAIQFSAGETKGDREERIPLFKEAAAILRSLQDKAEEGAVYVFPGRSDGKGHRTTVRRQWARVVEAAGLQGLHLHDLRKTYVSQLKAAGHDMETIRVLARHASAETTRTHYLQIEEDKVQRQAVAQTPAAFRVPLAVAK